MFSLNGRRLRCVKNDQVYESQDIATSDYCKTNRFVEFIREHLNEFILYTEPDIVAVYDIFVIPMANVDRTDELLKENARLQSDLDTMRKFQLETQEIAQVRESRIDQLADKNKELIQQNIDLQFSNSEFEKQIKDLKRENADLRGNLQSAVSAMREIEAQFIASDKKNIALREFIPVVQFASSYPSWSSWEEFMQLPDYQYIDEMLDCQVVLRNNFQDGDMFYLIDRDCQSPRDHIVPPFGTSTVMKDLIASWEQSSFDYYSHDSLFDTSVKNPPGELHDFISLYIIGVLAGWLHLNWEKILPYEYVIFIDVGPAITFRLVTMKKHAECPKQFMFDKHRFIINGVSRV